MRLLEETRLALLFSAVIVLGISTPARAAIRTFGFSGIHNDIGAAPPAFELIPNYQIGDPYSGTITLDDAAPGSSGFYAGQPLAITLLFDSAYALNWTAPSSGDGITFYDDSFNHLTMIRKGEIPGAPAEFNQVLADLLSVDFMYGVHTPSSLAQLDPNSPDITNRLLRVRLHGPSLNPFTPGAEVSVFFVDTITTMNEVVVPEPSSLLLGGIAGTGLLWVLRRRTSRGRQDRARRTCEPAPPNRASNLSLA